MALQRPGRPQTRLGQPAVPPPAKAAPAKSATGRVTSVKPKTAATAPPPPPAKTARGRGAAPATRASRPAGGASAKKSNPMMLIGIAGGVVLLLGVGAFFMMGNSEKPAAPSKKEASKPKAVDVSGMEAQAEKMCREGLMIMQNNQTLLAKHDLSPSEKKQLVGELEKSKKLLGDGMGLLSQAKAKSDHEYDTKQYQEALITARKKLMELRD